MSSPTVNITASALAPDGLPWPVGYFDGPVKITMEQAVAAHGVRPSIYKYGRPVWQPLEYTNPNFKSVLAEEPPELIEKWTRELNQK